MNRISRILMMSGLGLATTFTLGVVPASAASATMQGTSSAVNNRHDDDDDDYDFRRWYRDRDDCRDDGRRGERREWWEDFYCQPDRTRHGIRWALMVQYDDDHDRHDGDRRRGGRDGRDGRDD